MSDLTPEQEDEMLSALLYDFKSRPKEHLEIALASATVAEYSRRPEGERDYWLKSIIANLDRWIREDAQALFENMEDEQ